MRNLLTLCAFCLTACGVSKPLAPDNPFLGDWFGRRTMADASSLVSDPRLKVRIVETEGGLAQTVCSDQPLSLEISGNHAESTGVVLCTWSASVACPRAEVHTATLELKPGPHLSIVETYELVDCAGERAPLRWEFEGGRELPIVVPTRPPEPTRNY